ncbi:hypothetical protein QOT17_011178 [Balamuthia mandrillaris]
MPVFHKEYIISQVYHNLVFRHLMKWLDIASLHCSIASEILLSFQSSKRLNIGNGQKSGSVLTLAALTLSSLLISTLSRTPRFLNGLHVWASSAIQQSEEDSKCPACDTEEETAEHFLLRRPNLWEDHFRIWSVDNGNEEQVRKLIIEDCTTKLLSSGKKCNRAQEMEQCKQSCKRVWRLWAARASWKHGSSSALYQSLEVM